MDSILLVFATASFTALMTRTFWPRIETKTETRFVDPRPMTDPLTEVRFFALDPATGQVMYGTEGAVIDHTYTLAIDVRGKDDEFWTTVRPETSSYSYRIRLMKPNPWK